MGVVGAWPPGACPWVEALLLLLLLGCRAEGGRPEPWVQLLPGGREGEREGVWARLPRLGLVFS